MLSPKIPTLYFAGVEEGECWQPTFDAESRNAKIPNSHFHTCERLVVNF